MPSGLPKFDAADAQEALGYMNFSAGAPDPKFLRSLSQLYRGIEGSGEESPDTWRTVRDLLRARLGELEQTAAAFRDAEQARRVLNLLFHHFMPAYRQHHVELLFHLGDGALWRPFFLGRATEAILLQGPPWGDVDRIVDGALGKLNDFIGHRPVAVLRTTQRIEPYRKEWIRPIPLYIRGAGVAEGRFERLVQKALAILQITDTGLLSEAQFDPALLDELAVDPRAYDFDHPANKRPNYQFGQWDPHHLDNQGRFRRFVLVQVTLDGLLDRVERAHEVDPEELFVEAAAVLAGTILMGAGISGSSPEAHDSATTLATLLPRIANYRDSFYQQFLQRLEGPHAARLKAEAAERRQPLAAARQHLNQFLARRRAAQLEHVHLALLFARMGYPDAARRQTAVVAVASARLATEIQCRITTGELALEMGAVRQATAVLPQIDDLLHRAIECGALVDPWNILGFQGQFSLFAAPENSVPDHRIDQLIDLLEQVFGLYARLWAEAAALADDDLQESISAAMSQLAAWWDQFAATTVEGIEGFSGSEAFASARQVAQALQAWHKGGAAAGDIGFWRRHAPEFNSPKAYALVVDALLDKHDFIAARALLSQWLSQAAHLPLAQGAYSLNVSARRWLDEVCKHRPEVDLVEKFFDYLEANAEEYWQVPSLGLSEPSADDTPDDPSTDDETGIYHAAYDEMVYVDSTDDGVESEMLEGPGIPATEFELEQQAKRIQQRMMMLATVAALWHIAATALKPGGGSASLTTDTLERWLRQAHENRERLVALLHAIARQPIPAPTVSRDSLMEFERRRTLKESLLEAVITTTVATISTVRLLRALSSTAADAGSEPVLLMWQAVLSRDVAAVRRLWPDLMDNLRGRKLLYIPLARGGDPAHIAAARDTQQTMRELLAWLPRLGLLGEACQLLAAARQMEIDNPVGAGAISEFDRLFELGYRSLVESLVTVSLQWTADRKASPARQSKADSELVDCLEQMTEGLLKQWLAHSRTLRLSTLEKISDEQTWLGLVEFIKTYGHDLFTTRFLNLANLRAILHQGVDAWLARLQEDPQSREEMPLIADLDRSLNRADAVKYLGLVIEGLTENYAEYRDYNSTTTQSDRGELLYMLLDLLRLRAQYDRVAWHLRPVLLAHEILVRHGRTDAAELWRRSLAERTSEVADRLQQRLAELQQKYGMRLPSIADRLAERFVRPLSVDRVRALVEPAMKEVRGSKEPVAFRLLEQETAELTQEPTGAGLDVPSWLRALEEEVDQVGQAGAQADVCAHRERLIPQVPLSAEEVQRELTAWETSTPEL